MLFTWWLTSVFFYVAYVIRSPTSAVDVIEKHDSQDRQGGAAADDVLRPYYNNAADVLFTSSTSSSSSSGYHVIRDRFLPNGVRVFGIFGRRDCVLSCVLPCTAADFDERRAGGSCWHHYHQHGCSALTVYRPGTTHSRNVVCSRPPHSRRNVDDKRYDFPTVYHSASGSRDSGPVGLHDTVFDDRTNPPLTAAAAAAALIVPHAFGGVSYSRLQPPPPSSLGLLVGSRPGWCGRPALPPYEARIVGGDEARPRSWPWQIALRNKNSRSSRCAGSLIAQQWVLTTAHCVDQDPDPNNWLVLTGAHDLLAIEAERIAYSVDRIVIHKQFSLDTFDNDIALLRLVNPVEWSAAVSPVCLPPADLDLDGGTKCVITGWGVAGNGKRPLKQAGIPLVSADTCKRSDWLGSEFTITERMICAGFASGGVDTCQGDSGGPLMCYLEGHWVQIGVTSFGRGCGLPQKPGIYTKVSKFTQWIQSITTKRRH